MFYHCVFPFEFRCTNYSISTRALDHHNGWVTLGAAVVGGLVGGLLGACQ